MQTRRDQLQAYRFQNRRALAALVTGQPNVVDPPMRRLTAMTLAGVMIAIVVIAVFGILGIVKPTTGDAWKNPGAIIVERETGATYVRIANVLHPVLNYSSAVLAVGTEQSPHVELVDRSDIASAKHGSEIGIDDVPGTLPPASGLVSAPWTVCSQQRTDTSGRPQAQVRLYAGSQHGARRLPTTSSQVVRSIGHGALHPATRFLLQNGTRYALPSTAVLSTLHLDQVTPADVGTAFLDALPVGPALQVPRVLGIGHPSAVHLNGVAVTVGRLLRVNENGNYVLALPDGVSPELTPVQAAILQALPTGPAGQYLSPLPATESDVLGQPHSGSAWAAVRKELGNLPPTVATPGGDASGAGGLCAVFGKDTTTPVLAVPPGSAPSFTTGAVSESAQSAGGHVDSVVIGTDNAAVVKADDGSATEFVIANPGKRYAVAKGVLGAFGYAKAKPSVLSTALLGLVPRGAALDPTAARRPVHG